MLCFFSCCIHCRIFFEPEAFFCKPGELPSKEEGGVALLKGKKVRIVFKNSNILNVANNLFFKPH